MLFRDWSRRGVRCERVTEAALPTDFGSFRILGYRDCQAKLDHVALTMGNLSDDPSVPLRIQSECLTGEVFRSRRCDCGDQLAESMAYIAQRGVGVVVYLRGQEGRGIGIIDKLRAYSLQDDGADTISANTRLGLPVDARDFSAVACILQDLRVNSVELLSNNPDKLQALLRARVSVSGVRASSPNVTAANLPYLITKRDVLGHSLVIPD